MLLNIKVSGCSVNSFVALFWLFRGPPNSTFWWFKYVFCNLLREKHSDVERPRETACFLIFSLYLGREISALCACLLVSQLLWGPKDL